MSYISIETGLQYENLDVKKAVGKGLRSVLRYRNPRCAWMEAATRTVGGLGSIFIFQRTEYLSKSLWRWYINTSIVFLDIIHRLVFI
jgi:hypothetical protein